MAFEPGTTAFAIYSQLKSGPLAPPECTTLNAFAALTTTSGYFWLIVGVVALLALQRFNTHRLPLQKFDPPLPNRYFTTTFRYSFASAVYALMLVTVFGIIVLSASIEGFLELVFQALAPLLNVFDLNLSQAKGLCNEQFGVLYPSLDVLNKLTVPVGADTPDVEGVGLAPLLQVVTLDQQIQGVLVLSFTFFVLLGTTGIATRLDQRLRDWLHGFASVPAKARMLADQIIAGVPLADNVEARYAELGKRFAANRWSDPRVFIALRRIVDDFLNDEAAAFPNYNAFFRQTEANVLRLQERLDFLHKRITHDESTRDYYNREMKALVSDMAVLVACGILKNEQDEIGAARMLTRLGFSGIEKPRFRFSPVHIAVGGLIVLILAGLNLAVVSIGVGYATGGGDLLKDGGLTTLFVAGSLMGLGHYVISMLLYLLPLILAAGVQTYMSDREYYQLNGGQRELVSFMSLTFFLSFVVAAMSLLIMSILPQFFQPDAMAASTGAAPRADELAAAAAASSVPELQLLLPWALSPALFAASFVLMNEIEVSKKVGIDLAFDFVVFFLVAAGSTWLAAQFVYQQSPEGLLGSIEAIRPYLTDQGEETMVTVGYALASGFLAGTLGTAMSYLSHRRQDYVEDAAARIRKSQGVDKIAPAFRGGTQI